MGETEFKALLDRREITDLCDLTRKVLAQYPDNQPAKIYQVICHRLKNDSQRGLELGLRYLEELTDPLWKGRMAKELGVIYWYHALLDKAESYYDDALLLFEESGSVLDQAAVYNNKAILYGHRGDYETSLQHCQLSLELKRQLNPPGNIASTLANIGILRHYMGRYSDAIDSLDQAYHQFEKEGYPDGMINSLYHQIMVYLDQEKMEEAEECYAQIGAIVASSNGPASHPLYILSKAAILKETDDLASKVEAIELLDTFLETISGSFELKLSALQILLGLQIMEYKLYGHPDVLSEIQSNIGQMSEIAEQNNMLPLLVDIAIIQAKLAEITGQFEEVEKYISEAETIVHEHNLSHIHSKIDTVKTEIEERLDHMRTLLETNSTVIERVNKSRLEEYLKSIKL